MKSVSRRLHGGGTVAALIAVLLSPDTAKAEGNVVPIDRSPILLFAAMPGDLVCVFDEDDDGLDDEIEEQIAQAFVPQFRFDADEEHTGAAEPHAVFNMRATLDEDGSIVLHVKYVFVWHEDGGFVSDTYCQNFFWDDDHAGDTQPMSATVRLVQGAHRWYARLENLSGFVDAGSVAASDLQYYETHPVVFPSAGKHHFYSTPGEHEYPGDIADCSEKARGDGVPRTPIVQHVPHGTESDNLPPAWALAELQKLDPDTCQLLPCASVCVDDPVGFEQTHPWTMCVDEDDAVTVPVCASYCTDYPRWTYQEDGKRRWLNACVLRRTEEEVAAVRSLRPLDLTDWGYPIDSVSPSFLSRYFRSYETGGVYFYAQNTAEDVDGDGLKRWEDPCPMVAGAWSGVDSDGDGVGDHCDPAPHFKSVYVARGNEQYPAVPVSTLVPPGSLTQGWLPSRRAGFLDVDQDGYPDGEDRCPFNKGGGDDGNAWGQGQNWQPLEAVGAGKNDELGVFYRGDICDPYPVAKPSWIHAASTGWTGSAHCVKPGWRSMGASEVRISHHAGQGVSNNDKALLAQASQATLPPTSYRAQTFRCACVGFSGSGCVESELSLCYRNDAVAQANHTPVTWGRGWRAIDREDCTEADRDDDGYCGEYPLPVPFFGLQDGHQSGNTPDVKWTWLDELVRDGTSVPGDRHFASSDFVHIPASGEGLSLVSERWVSAHPYVLWTWVGADNQYVAPVSKKNPPDPNRFLPDPEEFDTELVPNDGPNTSAKSRRLRAGHDTLPRQLTSLYSVFDGQLHGCPTFNLKYKVHVRWPDEIIRWPDTYVKPLLDLILAVQGPAFHDTYLLRGDTRQAVSVNVTAELTDSWIRTAPGLTAALTNVQRNDSFVLSLSDAEQHDVLAMPDLLRVGQGVDGAQRAVLRATQFDGQVVSYGLRDGGALPVPVGENTRLVTDQQGTFAALVEPSTGEVYGFEPMLRIWMRARVPAEAVDALGSGNLALLGSGLIVVSSQPDDAQRGAAWLIDIHGREATPLQVGLPAREDAQLVLSTNRDALLLVGGRDASGALHDDVWSLALAYGNDEWSSAKKVRSDSALPLSSSTSVVTGSSDGQELRAWVIRSEDDDGLITPVVRTDRGWLELDGTGLPVATTCPQGDQAGGQLCRVEGETKAWWANVGMKACADAAQPGQCIGMSGEAVSETTIQTHHVVADVATDGSSVWALTRRSLHRYRLGAAGQTEELASAQLLETGRSLGASPAQVLLGTDGGVRLVTMVGNELLLGPVLELCGRPVRIAHISGSLWAVGATLGTAVVSTAGDTPSLVSMSMILPGSGTGEVHPLSMDGSGIQACRDTDGKLGEGQVRLLGESSALAPVSAKRLLVVRGAYVVDVNLSDPSAPLVQGSVNANTALRWLKADRLSGRAYGVGVGGVMHRQPVFQVEQGALELTGQHDIPEWVKRLDAKRMSVSVKGPKRVDVAEVLR